MTELLHGAALLCVAAGLIAGALAGIASRDGRVALRVALDLWLAAGLLNLTNAPGWEPALVAGLIILIRQSAGPARGQSSVRVRGLMPSRRDQSTG